MSEPPTTRVLGVGHVGRRLLETLGADGQQARGTVRSTARADLLRDAGLHCTALDLDQPSEAEALGALLEAGERLIVTLPPDDEGLRADALAAGLQASPPERVLLLSSTGVYAEKDGGRVDEDAALADHPTARRRRYLEETLARACEAIERPLFVLRLPAIYGRSRGMHQSLQAGRMRLWGGGRQVTNRVHVDDIVSALLLGLEAPPWWAGTYNLSDDHSCPLVEVVGWLSERLDLPLPEALPLEDAPRTLQSSRRVDSTRFRERFGWAPRYPTYVEGFEQILSGL